MTRSNKRITPDRVTELSTCEVFVFGSNLQGQHYGGAARLAHECFGAQWGVGSGPTGRCYAIPTMHGSIEDIRPYVEEFCAYAQQHPNTRFLVTRVGCGIAGFSDEDIAPLFEKCSAMDNVSLPREWLPMVIPTYISSEVYPQGKAPTPAVVSEQMLRELCQQYAYQIGTCITERLPSIRIRYIVEEGLFGYKSLGDFFFLGEDLYVFDLDDAWAEAHNSEAVLQALGDECYGRGYAHRVLFAGVSTRVRDLNDELIYTGDVLELALGQEVHHTFALGDFDLEEKGGMQPIYAFILDNHYLSLEEALRSGYSLRRVGTVFYRLDWQETRSVNSRVLSFNLCAEEGVSLFRSTPSFISELEGCSAPEITASEYHCKVGAPNSSEGHKSKINSQQLGQIGEYLVAAKLIERGMNAFLANMSLKNCPMYDIVCVAPKGDRTALVQVKTTQERNIPTGFSLGNATKQTLQKRIVGPWVFVHRVEDQYRFFVLSRSEVIQLIYQSNDWYVNRWRGRKSPLNLNNVLGLNVSWLEGKGEPANDRHEAFDNPLLSSAEDCWDKIWQV